MKKYVGPVTLLLLCLVVLCCYNPYIIKKQTKENTMEETGIWFNEGIGGPSTTSPQGSTYNAQTTTAPSGSSTNDYLINQQGNTVVPWATDTNNSAVINQTIPQYSSQQLALRDTINPALATILASAQSAASRKGSQTGAFNTGISWLDAQNALNQRGIQNEMARKTGNQDILSMVNRGVKSAGNMLANKNAGSSGAADEIARIYGKLGKAQMSTIGNQYGLANDALMTDQAKLTRDQDNYLNVDFANQKEDIIAGIVDSARTQLAALNESLIGASLPDRIAIEDEINKIKQAAQGELAKVDTILQQGLQTARGATKNVDQTRTEALRLMNEGTAPTEQFNYSTDVPMNWYGTQGPAGGNLPIFTFPRNKKQVA